VEGHSKDVTFGNLNQALADDDVQVRFFGKPEVKGQRRMGVALARGSSIEQAKEKAIKASSSVSITLG
jgi:phosphoribosylglycinamide formyltransferase 2